MTKITLNFKTNFNGTSIKFNKNVDETKKKSLAQEVRQKSDISERRSKG